MLLFLELNLSHLISQQHSPLKSTAIFAALLSISITHSTQANEAQFIQSATKQATTVATLASVGDWNLPAKGVWIAAIGDMSNELRYTELAAEAPRMDRLNTLGKPDFTFDADAIKYSVNPDGRLMIRIPYTADEKSMATAYRSTRATEPAACSHSTRITRALAAVAPMRQCRPTCRPKAGVFFNTAAFLEVYKRISSRQDAPSRPLKVDRNSPANEVANSPALGKRPWQASPMGASFLNP